MKMNDIEEIITCMPSGKTFFPYFQGRYALLLLSWIFDDEITVQEVKQSRYSGLLKKPCVKDALSTTGERKLSVGAIAHTWQEPHEQFLLTLGTWGGSSLQWQQTSRVGHNLVLQLNLHEGYRRTLEALLPDDLQYVFDTIGHPVLEPGQREFFRQTLGWARMDIDLTSGEALIEEIQSDWIRDATALTYRIYKLQNQDHIKLLSYVEFILFRLRKIWDEALLSAALWFLKEELGVTTIWYHTFATGNKLKRIKYRPPPKSLYSKLPRRFCFAETQDHPEFLLHDKSFRRGLKSVDSPRWFQIQL